MKRNIDPIKKMYSPIGQLAIAFSQLEESVIWLISALISGDLEFGEIICSQISFRQMFSIMDGLYRKKVNDPKLLADLDWIIKNCSLCEQYRNKIIHSSWGGRTGNYPIFSVLREKSKIKIGKGYKLDREIADENKIKQAAREILEMKIHLNDFIINTEKKGFIKALQAFEIIPDEYI